MMKEQIDRQHNSKLHIFVKKKGIEEKKKIEKYGMYGNDDNKLVNLISFCVYFQLLYV